MLKTMDEMRQNVYSVEVFVSGATMLQTEGYIGEVKHEARTEYAKLCVCYLIQGYELLLWRSYVRRTCANVMPKTKTFFAHSAKKWLVSSLPFPRTFL